MPHRVARASVTIQKELGPLISSHLKDPRLPEFVAVTHVELAGDLSTARVFISTPGDEEERTLTVEVLQAAAGHLGKELQSRIRIRKMPKLIFAADDTLQRGESMSDKIDKALEEDRKLRTRRESK